MIKKCEVCRDDRRAGAKYQDKTYGPGFRVHNPQGGKNRDKCRCTVCGTTRGQ